MVTEIILTKRNKTNDVFQAVKYSHSTEGFILNAMFYEAREEKFIDAIKHNINVFTADLNSINYNDFLNNSFKKTKVIVAKDKDGDEHLRSLLNETKIDNILSLPLINK